MKSKKRRIGIFRGTFDPIHIGHVSFALKAITKAKLDELYFLVEPMPPHKKNVSDFVHRLKMVYQTVEPYQGMHVLDLGNTKTNASNIITKLKAKFKSTTFVFLMGSDVAKTLPQWSNLEIFCEDNEIIIALRNLDEKNEIVKIIDSLPVKMTYATVISAPVPSISSTTIRNNIYQNNSSIHIDNNVHQYITTQQLYKK